MCAGFHHVQSVLSLSIVDQLLRSPRAASSVTYRFLHVDAYCMSSLYGHRAMPSTKRTTNRENDVMMKSSHSDRDLVRVGASKLCPHGV